MLGNNKLEVYTGYAVLACREKGRERKRFAVQKGK